MRRPEDTLDEGERRELADLEAELGPLVATVRPEPRPAWTAELDRRAEAGFARPRRTPLRSWLRTRTLLPAAGLAAAALVVVIAVAGSGGESPSTVAPSAAGGSSPPATKSFSGSSANSPAAPSATQAAPSAAGAGAESAPAAPLASPTHRRVERGTQLTVAVRHMQAAGRQVFGIASDLGGNVDSSNVSSGPGGSGSFVLRVPAGRLAAAVKHLAALGHVRTETNSTRDVTKAYTSATDRLADGRAERVGILKSLAKATTQGQIDSLKARLRLVEGQIATDRAQVRDLRARTDDAQIQLTLVNARRGVVAPPPGDHGGWSPDDALHTAGRILAVSAGVGLVVLAVLIPLGALAALGWGAAAAARRRRRHAALQSV